ncbi:MAG: endolytic transglycosylase MltG, partial [Deltaproteobacteria bacterium]|nr:endolytic transglycosylase MltG [Deltaproteobacteria bacterium]
MLKKKTFIPLIIIVFIILASFLFIRNVYQYADKPADANAKKKILIIRPGQNITRISANLHEMGVITSPIKFKILSRLRGLDKKLKTGEYSVSASMSPDAILDRIVNGRIILYRITVPEGYNLSQISTVIAKSNLGTYDEFYQSASDPVLTRQLGLDTDTFEGYLFPDTYFFPKGVTPIKIIKTMLSRFQYVFTKE